MQFAAHLRLLGAPREIAIPNGDGTSFTFWSLSGVGVRVAFGSLAAAVLFERAEDPGTLVQNVDIGSLDFLGMVYFPADQAGKPLRDSEKMVKLLSSLHSGDTIKIVARLGFRYVTLPSGARVRENNLALVKAELLAHAAPVEAAIAV